MTGRLPLASRRAFARQLVLAGGAGVALACAAPSQARNDAASSTGGDAAATQAMLVIDHVMPRRDFVGPQPGRFAWTAAAGADRYAVGVWDEVDRLIWRSDDIAGTSIDRPAGLDLEPGTYFWSVSGLQRGREIARSGQAAFVVE